MPHLLGAKSFLCCATLSSPPAVTRRWGGTWPGAPSKEEATDTYQPLCLGPHSAAPRRPFDLIESVCFVNNIIWCWPPFFSGLFVWGPY